MGSDAIHGEARDAAADDFYGILGVHAGADHSEIRRRYRLLALENHPDRVAGDEEKARAASRFKQIREAYEVLSSAEQRRNYDASRATGRPFVAVSRAAEDVSLDQIFQDVDRFPFPEAATKGADERLMKHFNETALHSGTLRERIIATYSVGPTDIEKSHLSAAAGMQTSVSGLIVTNFRVLIGVKGESAYRTGNSEVSMTYWHGLSTSWARVGRMELGVVSGCSSSFELILFGGSTPLSGVKFLLHGSPAPFLWMGSLYSIPLEPRLDLRVAHRAYAALAVVSALLGFVAITLCVRTLGGSWWEVLGLRGALLLAPLGLILFVSVAQNIHSSSLARLHRLIGA
jgi:hypothetical protein